MAALSYSTILHILCLVVFSAQINVFPLYKSDIGYFKDVEGFGFTHIEAPKLERRIGEEERSDISLEPLRYKNHKYDLSDSYNKSEPHTKEPDTSESVHSSDINGHHEIKDGSKHSQGYYDKFGKDHVKKHKSKHHHDERDREKHEKYHNSKKNEEKGGKNKKFHDEDDHYKQYHEGKEAHKAAKFGEKKGHKKGHKTKGYHNTFHRDEYHKEHKFYDDAHKSGYYDKNGDKHSYYDNKDGGYKKGKSHKSGYGDSEHGKQRLEDKGHIEEDHQGFKGRRGYEKFHDNYRDYKRDGEKQSGKHYGYKTRH